MPTEITIPNFDFSGFYYAEILERLIQYKRANLPELTDESEFEPSIQFLRAFSLVGHLNNTLLDLIANESTLSTAQLPEVIRNMLRLIDYELSPAAPAQVDLVYELSKVFSSSFELIKAYSQASTSGTDKVYFETSDALTISRTDQHYYVFGYESGTGLYTDFTTEANSQVTPANDFTPWSGPAIGDAIYWGHPQVMTDAISMYFTTPVGGGIISGVFEYYDYDWRRDAPTSVTDLGATLQFDLTTLLGSTNKQGTTVRIQLNSTTAYEEVVSVWSGSANIATTTLLGQTTPSADAEDYTVGSNWVILDTVTDGTVDLSADGTVDFTLPQTVDNNWVTSDVDGNTAFWIRYRIVGISGGTAPVFQYTRMDESKQYVSRPATQGRSITDDPLGSSNGADDQRFETSKDYFIWNSETVTVDSEEWTRVDNFLNSRSGDKHYMIELGDNDRATVVFGGGGEGKPPSIGVGNIAIDFRYGADLDGNTGANTVTTDNTGLTFINKVWNPRQATGWSEAESASEESLERAKIAGPASIRTKTVALGPDDVIYLTVNFVDSNGASPFSRAKAIEEGYGPKTIELVLVASGGGIASASQITAIEEYFNGDAYSVPIKEKHLVANQEVTAVNYTQKSINVTATVYGDVTVAAVKNQLTQKIQPEAYKSDGVTYQWDFGGEVPLSHLNHVIFDTDTSITKVAITTPSADVSLQTRELPMIGTMSITVVTP